MTSSLRPFLSVFLVALVGLGLLSCDVGGPLEGVDLVLDVEDASVSVGNVTTEVRTDRPTIRTQDANPDVGVKDVRQVRSIRLKSEYFTFSPAAGSQSKSGANAMSSGVLDVWVFFGSYPLPSTPISLTITDDVITDIDPSTLDFGGGSYTIDVEELEQLLADLGADAPDLGDWENATIDEVEAAINAALEAEGSPFSIAVEVVEGDLSGSLTIDQFSIDAQVTK